MSAPLRETQRIHPRKSTRIKADSESDEEEQKYQLPELNFKGKEPKNKKKVFSSGNSGSEEEDSDDDDEDDAIVIKKKKQGNEAKEKEEEKEKGFVPSGDFELPDESSAGKIYVMVGIPNSGKSYMISYIMKT